MCLRCLEGERETSERHSEAWNGGWRTGYLRGKQSNSRTFMSKHWFVRSHPSNWQNSSAQNDRQQTKQLLEEIHTVVQWKAYKGVTSHNGMMWPLRLLNLKRGDGYPQEKPVNSKWIRLRTMKRRWRAYGGKMRQHDKILPWKRTLLDIKIINLV